MKLGLAMEEYQRLQMHLNLRSDFTGSFARISNTISSGRSWLHVFLSHGTFSYGRERERVLKPKNLKQ